MRWALAVALAVAGVIGGAWAEEAVAAGHTIASHEEADEGADKDEDKGGKGGDGSDSADDDASDAGDTDGPGDDEDD